MPWYLRGTHRVELSNEKEEDAEQSESRDQKATPLEQQRSVVRHHRELRRERLQVQRKRRRRTHLPESRPAAARRSRERVLDGRRACIILYRAARHAERGDPPCGGESHVHVGGCAVARLPGWSGRPIDWSLVCPSPDLISYAATVSLTSRKFNNHGGPILIWGGQIWHSGIATR